MVFFRIQDEKINPKNVEKYLHEKGIKTILDSSFGSEYRLMTHRHIREEQIEEVVLALEGYKEWYKKIMKIKFK